MRIQIRILLFLAIIIAISSCRKNRNYRNLVVLFTDDQRFNTIGAWGNEEVYTPNMDRLAKMGMSFENTYVMGSHHGGVCAPSRAMLLSGRPYFHIPREFIDRGRVPSNTHFDFTTFPELLKKKGYNSFFTGKWHNNNSKIAESFTEGSNIFIGGMHWPKDGGHRRPQLWDFDSTSVYPQKNRWQANNFSSKMYSDAAIDFIKSRGSKKPFCLYVAYTSPHDPREAPEKFRKMYDSEKITLPPNFQPQHPFDNGHLYTRDESLLPLPRTKNLIKKEIAAYYAMISEVDAQIGRIIDALEQKKLLDNTIIVFAGDNGLAVGQHGLLGKQSVYEHSVKVPMIIAAPGFQKNQKTTALCYLYDIYPTICDLVKIKTPLGVEGKSLYPVLQNSLNKHRDHVFLSHAREMRAVRTDDDWKFIRYFVNGREREQLFNLSEDEWEVKNLAEDPDFSEKKEELENVLLQDIQIYDDDFIRPFIHRKQEAFDRPVAVSINASFSKGQIRYTLDGGTPDLESPIYENPFMLKKSGDIKAAVFWKGKKIGLLDSTKVRINNNVQDIYLTPAPSSKYAAKGKITLLDGTNGNANIHGNTWLGFEGENVEVLIIFKQEKSIKELGLRYLNQPGSWIFPPPEIKILISKDGNEFKEILMIKNPKLGPNQKSGPIELKKAIANQSTRYLKFEIKNQGRCPGWHTAKGEKAWLFLDELIMN